MSLRSTEAATRGPQDPGSGIDERTSRAHAVRRELSEESLVGCIVLRTRRNRCAGERFMQTMLARHSARQRAWHACTPCGSAARSGSSVPPSRCAVSVSAGARSVVPWSPWCPGLVKTSRLRKADPSPSENLSLLPVTPRLVLLMFFNLHDTSERGRGCSRAACRSWWPHLLLV
jgi:hypothetical protein